MPPLRDLLFVATDAPGDETRRRLAARGAVALAGAGFCLSLACAFTLPILFGVDERVHLAYVEVLLTGDLPEVDQPVPLDGRFVVLSEFYAGGTEAAGPRGDVWVANHPPLAYVVAAGPAWLAARVGVDRGPPMVLRLLCALGMALGALATAAVSDALLPGRRAVAVAVVGLTAFVPSLVSIGSYGYNDGLALAVGTALLATVLRVARWGPTRPRLVALIGLASLAVLTRSALLPLVALAAAVWLLRSWRGGIGRAAGGSALVAVVPAIVGGWFYLRNIDLYGSVTGSGHLQRKFARAPSAPTRELLFAPRFFLGTWQDLWASFRSNLGLGSGSIVIGSPKAQLGSRLFIGGGLAVASALGGLRALRRPRPRAPGAGLPWAVALAWFGICVAGLASFASGGGSPHPRYLFPAIGVISVLLVAGLARVPGPRAVLPAAVALLVSVDLVLYRRIPEVVAARPFPARFDQPGPAGVVAGAALLAMAALLVVGARAAWRLTRAPAVRG